MSDADVKRDWPSDPANEDLAKVAAELQSVVAPLPAEALERVRQQMQKELDGAQRWQRRRRIALGWSIAAAVLLALSGYAYFRSDRDAVVLGPPRLRPELVEDRITVSLAASDVTAATDKPLVRLDDYRSLFAD